MSAHSGKSWKIVQVQFQTGVGLRTITYRLRERVSTEAEYCLLPSPRTV